MRLEVLFCVERSDGNLVRTLYTTMIRSKTKTFPENHIRTISGRFKLVITVILSELR